MTTQRETVWAAFDPGMVGLGGGSRARGDPRPDSDLDLAVLTRKLDAGDRLRVQLALIGALAEALGPLGERTDLLDLRAAGSAIAFRVIAEGILVIARSAVLFHQAALDAGRRLGEVSP